MPKLIHNGDHAEFELEHANVPPRERPDWPYPSFAADDWAEAFVRTARKLVAQGKSPEELLSDMDWLRGWFANALMRGYDEAQMHGEPESEPVPKQEEKKADDFDPIKFFRSISIPIGVIPHPGFYLKEYEKAWLGRGLSLANQLLNEGLALETYRNITEGRANVTLGIALRLGRVTGLGVGVWLGLQERYNVASGRYHY